MAAPNFELITELQTCTRRDFPVGDPDILNPHDAENLVDGEWLALNASYQLVRGTNLDSNAAVFPAFVERGRYDTQAIGKVTVLMFGQYEAETKVFDEAGITTVGQPLMVADVDIGDGVTRRGLKLATTDDGACVVGYVTKVPTGAPHAGGKLRFMHTHNHVQVIVA
jgi:hypothetical protein